MDAFYASVEQRDFPELRGLPVVVGGDGQRGVVAAASYEARQFGVRSAMPMREAKRRCPQLRIQPVRMQHYKEVSAEVFTAFREITPEVEGLSLDEAFLDISRSQKLLGDPAKIGLRLKSDVKSRTQLTVSVGIAPNKLVAKIASDLNKPDGFAMIAPDDLPTALDPLSVAALPGIGPTKVPKLQRDGLTTLRDLRTAPLGLLQQHFGRFAERVRDRAGGIDHRTVGDAERDRSISAECTFPEDLRTAHAIGRELMALSERVAARVRRKGWVAGTLAVKIRRQDFKTYSRQMALQPASAETERLFRTADSLVAAWRQEQPAAAIRLLGVAAHDLAPASQSDMFSPAASIDDTVDEIRDKFGNQLLGRARAVKAPGQDD